LGNILIIQARFESVQKGATHVKYEIPFAEIGIERENVIRDSIVLN